MEKQYSFKIDKCGALLYISNHFSYTPRSDLALYSPRDLESVFVEISFSRKSNFTIGCVYKHPDICRYIQYQVSFFSLTNCK